MGSTNHGIQAVTWQYFQDAKAYDFNQKDINILPRGIYQGGHLTRVTDSEIKLLPLTVVLGDNNVQVSVKTANFALLNAGTLDSGTISVATPYIVLRWAFVESISNYMEVHAVALGNIQTNDIVVGKCVISGGVLNPIFDYSNRTFLNVQNIVLRVEESELSELYVWVRAGRLQTTVQTINIAEQKIGPFTNPGAPNSRIDLVYIDTDGSIKIQQGTAAVSPTVPAYVGKLVIAEVRLVNGESYIPVSRITDVRSFLTSQSGQGQSSQVTGSTDLTATTSWTDMADMSITLTTKGGKVLLLFSAPFRETEDTGATFRFIIDGIPKVNWHQSFKLVGNQNQSGVSAHWLEVGLSASSHTFKVQWIRTEGNNLYQDGTKYSRVFTVIELN